MSNVVITIATWNNYQWLARCLESLKDYTDYPYWRAIVVDNGSTDETRGYLDSLGERFEVHHLEENRGFIGGTNFGLAQVKEGEHVLLLNDDTQMIDPQWLGRMFESLEGNVGAVGPVSNFVFGWQGVDRSVEIPMRRHRAYFLVGFCMLIRADAFKKVGLLDSRFGDCQNEDFDYSIRLARAGYEMVIDRATFVLHYGSRTTNRTGDAASFNDKVKRGHQVLINKWGSEVVESIYRTPEGLE